MPSLRDVAKELGVSISLVSKVLNDRLGTTGVRPELVAKIRSTAARMGYRKNFNALSLLAKRQNALAVFIHRHGALGSGMTEKLIEGIAEGAAVSFQRMNLQFFVTAEEFRVKSADMHPGMVDGLIVTGVIHPELLADLRSLRKGGVHVVTIYNEPASPAFPNVGIPNAELAEAATAHLIARGCRRILHPAVIAPRTEGHRRAIERAGLEWDPSLLIPFAPPAGFLAEAGADAVRQAMDRGVAFDGISAQSDTQAAGAINELVRRGVRVPEEVKVAGIDNAPFTEFCVVPITSVSQRLIERGRLAVEMMERLVSGGKVDSVSLPAQVRERASTS